MCISRDRAIVTSPRSAPHCLVIIMATVLLLCFPLVFGLVSGQYQPNWDSLDNRPLPKWYDQAKFGIFLHWGVYAVPSYGGGAAHGAAEWFWWDWQGAKASWAIDFMEKNYLAGFTYADFAPEFKAEMFDPDQWAELFAASGARYVFLYKEWPSPSFEGLCGMKTTHTSVVSRLGCLFSICTHLFPVGHPFDGMFF